MGELEKLRNERDTWRKWCQAAESREADWAKREEELVCDNAELRERVGELEEALRRIAEYRPETHLDRQLDSREEDASDLEMAAAYSGAFWQVQHLARSAVGREQAKPENQDE